MKIFAKDFDVKKIWECTVIQILDMLKFPAAEESLKYSDKRNRNLFNCWARRNFHRAIYHIQTRTSKDVFREMVLKKSANRNNPMMVAALHNNKESLEMFLFHIGSHPCLYTGDIDDILHNEDEYGDTLLALVVQQSGRLDAARNILLDMEKKHHGAEAAHVEGDPGRDPTEGRWELTQCLRKYLQPSLETQKALNDVENSLPKTTLKKAAIWVKVFLKSLFIQLSWFSSLTCSSIASWCTVTTLTPLTIMLNIMHVQINPNATKSPTTA